MLSNQRPVTRGCWRFSPPYPTLPSGGEGEGEGEQDILELPDVDVTIARLDEATDPLKQILGPNADLWQIGDNTRVR